MQQHLLAGSDLLVQSGELDAGGRGAGSGSDANLAGGRPFHGCAWVLFPCSVGGEHEAPDQLDRPRHLDNYSHERGSGSGATGGLAYFAGSVFRLAVCQPDDPWRRTAGFAPHHLPAGAGIVLARTQRAQYPFIQENTLNFKGLSITWRQSFGQRCPGEQGGDGKAGSVE